MVATKTLQLGEWSIPRGSLLGLPSATAGMNKNIWNAGTVEDPHPLERFWEERFLVYPNDPQSGPVRMQDQSSASVKAELAESDFSLNETSKEAIFSTRGLKGAYMPFNEDVSTCPGMQFAKYETLGTLVKIVNDYDIECIIPKGWEPRMNQAFFAMGTLPPADKVPFRIRLRAT